MLEENAGEIWGAVDGGKVGCEEMRESGVSEG